MIKCQTINIEGKTVDWEWKDAKTLEEAWKNDIDIPANDDPLIRVWIDDEEKIIPRITWFEDLLTMIGIDIW